MKSVSLTITLLLPVLASAQTYNTAGQQKVDVATVSAAGEVDDTDTLTPGTTEGTPLMCAATSDAIDSGDLGIVACNTSREAIVQAKQNGTWNVTNVSGTISLPTGASTAAHQVTTHGYVDGIEGLLTTIDTDTGVLAGAVTGTEFQVDVLVFPDNEPFNVAQYGGSAVGAGNAFHVQPGTAATWSVTNAGTFVVQEDGAALTALQIIDNLPVAQGSTTSGQSGALVQGAVTTGAPTYTTGQTSPLSLDTAGALRVTGGGGGTEYVVNAVAPADPTGATFTMERDDQLAALAEAEADWTNPRATSKGALWVAIPDASGDPITSFGGGTEYVTNVAAPTDPTGATFTMEIDTALTTLSTEVETEWTNPRSTIEGALWVQDFNSDAVISNLAAIADGIPLDDNTGVNIGTVDVATITAGDNNIGNVDVVTLPSVTIGTFPDNEPVDVAQMNGVAVTMGNGASGTGVQRVTIASDTTGVLSVDDNAAALTVDWAGTAPPIGAGTEATALKVTLATDSTGLVSVDDNSASLTVDTVAATGVRYISVGATEDEHAIDTGAGTLWSISATNTAATVAFLKCENDNAAGTAPGTDTPEFSMAIPGATTGAGFHVDFPRGFTYTTAWTCWIVTGAADSDVTEVGANEVMVNYSYE